MSLRDRIAAVLMQELSRMLPEDAPGIEVYRLADLVLREVERDDIGRLGDEDDDADT